MVKEMSQRLTAQMVCNNVVDAAKAPIYAYGIELLLSTLAGILALAAISLFLRVPFLWIPYLGGFVPIRLLGGGYHAKTHRSCITAFSFLYVASLAAEKAHIISSIFPLFSCVSNIIIMFLFAPVVPLNKPLTAKRRMANRCFCLLLGVLNLGLGILCSSAHWRNHWLMMYFAGSGMAGFSILLAVINNGRKR